MWKTTTHMYIRYDEMTEDNKISTYVRPFSKELWEAILIAVAIIGTCSFILGYVKKRTGYANSINYLSAFYHPIETFMNQCKNFSTWKFKIRNLNLNTKIFFADGSESQESTYMRITIIATRIVALFIVPAYSAFLLSFILYPKVRLPFIDITTFIQDGSYKLAFPLAINWDNWFDVSFTHKILLKNKVTLIYNNTLF